MTELPLDRAIRLIRVLFAPVFTYEDYTRARREAMDMLAELDRVARAPSVTVDNLPPQE